MGERADRLAADLKVSALSGPARALAEESVKVLERLEYLDAQLQGEESTWLGIRLHLPESVAVVEINAPLAEARQQGLALRALLAEYAKLAGVEAPAAPASKVDDLAKRRAERLAGGLDTSAIAEV